MIGRVVAAVGTAVVVAASAVLTVHPVRVEKVRPYVCEEDMPCWRCGDMGNRICGPVEVTR